MADRTKMVFVLQAKDEMSKVFSGVGKAVKSFGSEAKKAAQSAKTAFSSLLTGLKDLGSKAGSIAKKMGEQFKKALGGLGTVAKFALGGFAVAAGGAAAGLGVAVKEAGNFDHAMREVWTLTDWTSEKFDAMGQSILRASTAVPDSAGSMAKALYSLVSAGREGAGQFEILKAASKLGVAGVSDTSEAMGLLVSFMNAFGIESKDAMKSADMLFATVKAGQTTLSQMAQYIPVIFPTAKTIGGDPREVLSAFAALTSAMGGRLNPQAASGLASALKSLYSQKIPKDHPLKSFIEETRKLDPTQALARVRKLILQLPEKQRLAKLREIFPDATAAGAVATLINNWKTFGETLQFMYKKAPGSVERGFSIMADSLVTQSRMLKTNIQALAIQIGNVFLPVVKEVTSTLGGWVGIFSKINMSKVWEQLWGDPEEALPQVKNLFKIIKTEFFSLTRELEGGGVMTSFMGNVIMSITGLLSKASKVVFVPLMTEAEILMDKLMSRAKILFNNLMADLLTQFEGTAFGKFIGAGPEKIASFRATAAREESRQKLAGRAGGEYYTMRGEAKAQSLALIAELRKDLPAVWEGIREEGSSVFEGIGRAAVGIYRDLETGELKPSPGTAEGDQAGQLAAKGEQAKTEIVSAQERTHRAVLKFGGQVVDLAALTSQQQIVFDNKIISLEQKIEEQKRGIVTTQDKKDREKATAGTPQSSWGIAF